MLTLAPRTPLLVKAVHAVITDSQNIYQALAVAKENKLPRSQVVLYFNRCITEFHRREEQDRQDQINQKLKEATKEQIQRDLASVLGQPRPNTTNQEGDQS